MIIEVPTTKTVDVEFVEVLVPARYPEEIPEGLPFLDDNDVWRITIKVDSGVIQEWPSGKAFDIHWKVCDEGTYRLLAEDGELLAEITDDYVPGQIIPEGGDYINFQINSDGQFLIWPRHLNFSAFFPVPEDVRLWGNV